jgi:excisionase family DNA binding protein
MGDPYSLRTVEETAERLRLGRTYTYELIRQGKIPSIKLGKRRLVSDKAIEDYIRKVAKAS